MVYAAKNRPDGFGSYDLYISYLTPEGWSEGVNLGPKINSDQWESQPCFSPDKRQLYFTSRRFGGYGGNDIYVSRLQPNGRWSDPENLGPEINTPGSEACPFMLLISCLVDNSVSSIEEGRPLDVFLSNTIPLTQSVR